VFRSAVFLSVTVLLGAAPFLTQESTSPTPKTAAFSVPPDIAAKTNPVHPTAVEIALVRKLYGYDCAMCHGKEGAGDGDMAASLQSKMKDYRDPASLKGMTDGELFYIIQKGKGEMPSEGDRAKDDQIWTMVVLVHSFAKK